MTNQLCEITNENDVLMLTKKGCCCRCWCFFLFVCDTENGSGQGKHCVVLLSCEMASIRSSHDEFENKLTIVVDHGMDSAR